jgi:hypothetical protein
MPEEAEPVALPKNSSPYLPPQLGEQILPSNLLQVRPQILQRLAFCLRTLSGPPIPGESTSDRRATTGPRSL